jgi:DNA-binding response OmpR family regulator
MSPVPVDVLVVEDAPEFTRVVSTVLGNEGHRVRAAATVADALIELDEGNPDVVILDLTLPDGDGLDLCR